MVKMVTIVKIYQKRLTMSTVVKKSQNCQKNLMILTKKMKIATNRLLGRVVKFSEQGTSSYLKIEWSSTLECSLEPAHGCLRHALSLKYSDTSQTQLCFLDFETYVEFYHPWVSLN